MINPRALKPVALVMVALAAMATAKSRGVPRLLWGFLRRRLVSLASMLDLQSDLRRRADEGSLPEVPVAGGKDSRYRFERVVGRGACGDVWLAVDVATGKQVAVKQMNKERMIKTASVERVIMEKQILQTMSHPFVISLKAAYQDEHNLYLVLDYVGGGDMFTLMDKRYPDTFTEDEVRFYVAEITLALEHLHSKQIIFRDLKPENVLLTLSGHVLLTDFGVATQSLLARTSFVGTPVFMAPEMLLRGSGSYGPQVDWWALGVLMYELLVGSLPFPFVEELLRHAAGTISSSTAPSTIISPTLDHNNNSHSHALSTTDMPHHGRQSSSHFQMLVFPSHLKLSDTVQSLLRGLLEVDPAKRLDAKAVKAHPFFSPYDWDDVFHQRLEPPVIKHLEARRTVENLLKLPTPKSGPLLSPSTASSFPTVSRFSSARGLNSDHILNLNDDNDNKSNQVSPTRPNHNHDHDHDHDDSHPKDVEEEDEHAERERRKSLDLDSDAEREREKAEKEHPLNQTVQNQQQHQLQKEQSKEAIEAEKRVAAEKIEAEWKEKKAKEELMEKVRLAEKKEMEGKKAADEEAAMMDAQRRAAALCVQPFFITDDDQFAAQIAHTHIHPEASFILQGKTYRGPEGYLAYRHRMRSKVIYSQLRLLDVHHEGHRGGDAVTIHWFFYARRRAERGDSSNLAHLGPGYAGLKSSVDINARVDGVTSTLGHQTSPSGSSTPPRRARSLSVLHSMDGGQVDHGGQGVDDHTGLGGASSSSLSSSSSTSSSSSSSSGATGAAACFRGATCFSFDQLLIVRGINSHDVFER